MIMLSIFYHVGIRRPFGRCTQNEAKKGAFCHFSALERYRQRFNRLIINDTKNGIFRGEVYLWPISSEAGAITTCCGGQKNVFFGLQERALSTPFTLCVQTRKVSCQHLLALILSDDPEWQLQLVVTIMYTSWKASCSKVWGFLCFLKFISYICTLKDKKGTAYGIHVTGRLW